MTTVSTKYCLTINKYKPISVKNPLSSVPIILYRSKTQPKSQKCLEMEDKAQQSEEKGLCLIQT